MSLHVLYGSSFGSLGLEHLLFILQWHKSFIHKDGFKQACMTFTENYYFFLGLQSFLSYVVFHPIFFLLPLSECLWEACISGCKMLLCLWISRFLYTYYYILGLYQFTKSASRSFLIHLYDGAVLLFSVLNESEILSWLLLVASFFPRFQVNEPSPNHFLKNSRKIVTFSFY